MAGFGLTKSAAVMVVLGTAPRAVLARVVVAQAHAPRPAWAHVWAVAQQVVVAVVLVGVGVVAPGGVVAPAEALALLPVVARVLPVVQVTAKGLGRNKETGYDFVKKYQRPSRGRGCYRIQKHE